MKSGNLLILQSGIPSVVGNAVLYGMLSEALNYEDIEEVYGAYDGFEGILSENFVDLAALSSKKANLLLSTEGYALKNESESFLGNTEDFAKCIDILAHKNIRFVAVIGSQESIKYVKSLSQAAQAKDYDLQTLIVPQSNYNELPTTDHSLGYGSCLKFLNSYVVSFSNFLRNSNIPVGICEIDGGSNGWLVAGSILGLSGNGKQFDAEGRPYLVCLPEQPFNSVEFIKNVQKKLEKNNFVCIVTHSQLVNEEGLSLDLEGNASVGAYLYNLIRNNLELESYLNVCELESQPLSHFISKADSDEAVLCGRETIKQLIEEGESDKIVVLTRKDNAYEVSFSELGEMAEGLKFFPSDWIDEKTMTINYSLVKYAMPLIQGEVEVSFEKGLPQFVQL